MPSDWIPATVAQYSDTTEALVRAHVEVMEILSRLSDFDDFDNMGEEFTIPPGIMKMAAIQIWQENEEAEATTVSLPHQGLVTGLFRQAYESPVTGDSTEIEGPASAFVIAYLLGGMTVARAFMRMQSE